MDETGAPVKGVHVVALAPGVQQPPESAGVTSDATGLFRLDIPAEGIYQVRATREGYFEFRNQNIRLDPDSSLEIQMNHLKELAESVDVRYSAPAIDPQETSEAKRLQAPELLNVPYPASQDYRSALPLMSGAIQDTTGQVHFNGGKTNESNYRLDGFDVADPATGNLTARLNVDTVQTLEFESSRFSPERGKGSAGTLEIQTRMGEDHWRFGGTNFIPGIGTQGGVYLNHWSPRVIVSGPIKKGKAWFHDAFDTFYSASTVSNLPSGQNRTSSISGSNLARFQWNIGDNHIVTGSLLLNREDVTRNGLSFLNPAETTINRRQSLYLGTIKDQWVLGGGLIEFGFADTSAYLRGSPQGNLPYVLTPFGANGNFFRDDTTSGGRQEWLLNGFVKPLTWHGTHQVEAGVNVERSDMEQTVFRHDLQVVRGDNSVVRQVQFLGSPRQFRTNVETYGYVLDRWRPTPALSVEAGFRTQWDEYTRGAPPAPRIAVAWAPRLFDGVKLSAGWGIFYDAVTLGMLVMSQEQTSQSTFFGLNGLPTGVPLESRFVLKPQDLRLPRYAISSFSVESRLPWNLYGRVNLTSREGSRGFSFAQMAVTPGMNLYVLDNIERERYRSAEFSVRRTFLSRYEWFASYTRSEARSNAVLNYSIENPLLTPQSGGPLPWDAPNRLLAWGWAPIAKAWFPSFLRPVIGDTDIQLLGDFRTGFPFSAINELGYVIGHPDGYRFPDFLTVNVALERRFPFRGYLWAWRVGLINALGRPNPNVVNTDFDSPEFRTFGRGQARAVNVRLRFIGKK